jgi:short subunit dehydrogenase-like uncharacterized protein
MGMNRSVAVYGAYGHTARFVVAELLERGWRPVLCGRDADKLAALDACYPDLEKRAASIDDADGLDRAFAGAMAVINCAGPFLDTAAPVIEAALRARIHYLDACAEQRAVQEVMERFAGPAGTAGITVVPAMAFFGGLADLLGTAALADWPDAEEIQIAVALDSWHPTAGTRLTGTRNHYRRMVVSNGELAPLDDPPPSRQWTFAAPFGTQPMVALPLSEIITLSSHLRVAEVHSYMNLAPLDDLRDPHTPAPTASGANGRSAQRFAVEVSVRRNGRIRRGSAQGRDIYAVTAPLLVEALQRLGDGRATATGVLAPGAAFGARDFLESLPELRLAFDEDEQE